MVHTSEYFVIASFLATSALTSISCLLRVAELKTRDCPRGGASPPFARLVIASQGSQLRLRLRSCSLDATFSHERKLYLEEGLCLSSSLYIRLRKEVIVRVPVVSKDGKPLMPTKPAKARKMIDGTKAFRIAQETPFQRQVLFIFGYPSPQTYFGEKVPI